MTIKSSYIYSIMVATMILSVLNLDGQIIFTESNSPYFAGSSWDSQTATFYAPALGPDQGQGSGQEWDFSNYTDPNEVYDYHYEIMDIGAAVCDCEMAEANVVSHVTGNSEYCYYWERTTETLSRTGISLSGDCTEFIDPQEWFPFPMEPETDTWVNTASSTQHITYGAYGNLTTYYYNGAAALLVDTLNNGSYIQLIMRWYGEIEGKIFQVAELNVVDNQVTTFSIFNYSNMTIATGIEENTSDHTLEVLTVQHGSITLSTPREGILQVYDIAGKYLEAYRVQPGTTKISMSWPSGVYLLEMGGEVKKIFVGETK